MLCSCNGYNLPDKILTNGGIGKDSESMSHRNKRQRLSMFRTKIKDIRSPFRLSLPSASNNGLPDAYRKPTKKTQEAMCVFACKKLKFGNVLFLNMQTPT